MSPRFLVGLLVSVFFFAGTEGRGEELGFRLRYNPLIVSQNERFEDNGAGSDHASSRYGFWAFQGVLKSGLGFGHSRVETSGEIDDGASFSTSVTNVDLSYTFGWRWSLTLGLGWVVSGEATLNEDGSTYKTKSFQGHSGFFTLGIPTLLKGMFPRELLIGLRQSNLRFQDLSYDNGNTTITRSSSLQLKNQHVFLGLGW